MAELSVLTLPNNVSYELADAAAREEIVAITNAEIDALFDGYDLSTLSAAEGESF